MMAVVLGVQAEPSPDCQLTGLDFPVWKSLVSVGEAGCWETGSEECPGLGSSKRNISSRQAPSVFQYHQPTSLTIGGPCHRAGLPVNQCSSHPPRRGSPQTSGRPGGPSQRITARAAQTGFTAKHVCIQVTAKKNGLTFFYLYNFFVLKAGI